MLNKYRYRHSHYAVPLIIQCSVLTHNICLFRSLDGATTSCKHWRFAGLPVVLYLLFRDSLSC